MRRGDSARRSDGRCFDLEPVHERLELRRHSALRHADRSMRRVRDERAMHRRHRTDLRREPPHLRGVRGEHRLLSRFHVRADVTHLPRAVHGRRRMHRRREDLRRDARSVCRLHRRRKLRRQAMQPRERSLRRVRRRRRLSLGHAALQSDHGSVREMCVQRRLSAGCSVVRSVESGVHQTVSSHFLA